MALQKLMDLLRLEKVADNRFIGQNQDLGLSHIFGGQLLGQALSAASQSVEAGRLAHSMHGYFLQAGSLAQPVEYETQTLREGRSFSLVNVNAMQDEQLIFRAMISFQGAEQGFEYQAEMPQVEPPAQLISEDLLLQKLAEKLPLDLQQKFSQSRPFDVRVKYANNPFFGQKLPAEQLVWAKANGEVADSQMQQCLFAYFSDFHSLPTALHPHARGFLQPKMRIASLDHSIWFHRPIDFNQWLLCVIENRSASNARGFVRGEAFDQQGNLVASYAQEGLIREEV